MRRPCCVLGKARNALHETPGVEPVTFIAMFDGPVADEAVLRALEGTGYQCVQTRGLMVLDSHMGLVACQPVGMAQVSSVVIYSRIEQPDSQGRGTGLFPVRRF